MSPSVRIATPYAAMTKNELWDEMEAWQKVVDAPKEPGCPSRAEREAAEREVALAGAWVHRIKMQEAK